VGVVGADEGGVELFNRFAMAIGDEWWWGGVLNPWELGVLRVCMLDVGGGVLADPVEKDQRRRRLDGHGEMV
jgi:hypothetical protein